MTTITAEAPPPDAVPVPPIRPVRERPALARPREALVTGTAAGLAAHLDWPVWGVRALFALTVPLLGAGVLFYLWLWMFTPWAPGESAPSRRAPTV